MGILGARHRGAKVHICAQLTKFEQFAGIFLKLSEAASIQVRFNDLRAR
jgi:hypothetical protein